MENYGKKWEVDEEKNLIDEINNLTEIDIIIDNHKRTITGIKSRIEKIFNNEKFNKELLNKNDIILKYFQNDTKFNNLKNNTYQEDILNNLLNFYNIEDLLKKYDKLDINQLKNILKNLQKYNNLEVYKKVRLSNLINNIEDYIEETTINKINVKLNIDNTDTKINTINNNINEEILKKLNEITDDMKLIKGEIFDLKNRVKSLNKKNKSNI
jgi:hypothetical protein